MNCAVWAGQLPGPAATGRWPCLLTGLLWRREPSATPQRLRYRKGQGALGPVLIAGLKPLGLPKVTWASLHLGLVTPHYTLVAA